MFGFRGRALWVWFLFFHFRALGLDLFWGVRVEGLRGFKRGLGVL